MLASRIRRSWAGTLTAPIRGTPSRALSNSVSGATSVAIWHSADNIASATAALGQRVSCFGHDRLPAVARRSGAPSRRPSPRVCCAKRRRASGWRACAAWPKRASPASPDGLPSANRRDPWRTGCAPQTRHHHLESLGQRRANFRIADRFCRRGADREAAARAILAAEIAGQSLAVQAPQHLAQRPIVSERFFHREVAEFPVAPERGEVELALVTERAIEARPIHAGRCAQIVERSRGIAGAPEAFGGALQRDLGIVGARPPARPRLRSLWLFLYHFAKNSLTRGTSSE